MQIYQQQIKSIRDLIPLGQLNQEALDEIQKLVKIEQKHNKEDLVYK